MKEKTYQDDLLAIRSMMERSSRFISLNGLAGVFAGMYALAGAAYAYVVLRAAGIYQAGSDFNKSLNNAELDDHKTLVIHLCMVASLILVLAIGTGIVLTVGRSKKKNLPVWDQTTKRLLINFSVPLIVGGLFILELISYGHYGFAAPATLLFYGLALFCGGNFTYPDIKYLGLCEIVLGLVSACFLGYGLLFWAVGFGLLHIIYGVWMYVKYK